jgi:hypothetical protein
MRISKHINSYKAFAESAHFVADDIVISHPAPLPKVEGKAAFIAAGANWTSFMMVG